MPTKSTESAVPTYTRPFSGARYHELSLKCREGQSPCAHCGRPCDDASPKTEWAHVVGGGAEFASKEEHDADGPSDDGGGDMGCFPVGPGCVRKLRAAGVHVFKMGAS